MKHHEAYYNARMELAEAEKDYEKETLNIYDCMTRNDCRKCRSFDNCVKALAIQHANLEIWRRRCS